MCVGKEDKEEGDAKAEEGGGESMFVLAHGLVMNINKSTGHMA